MDSERSKELYWKIWNHPRVKHKIRNMISAKKFSNKEYEMMLKELDKPKIRKQASKNVQLDLYGDPQGGN